MHDVPLSIISRSHTLNMVKSVPKKRFNKKSTGPAFPAARELIQKWKAVVSLNPDPEIPAVLLKDSRVADGCRPLIAIADSFGGEYGRTARAALIELCAGLVDQDPANAALNASKAVFDAAPPEVDRMDGKVLAKSVAEENDYFADWRGINDQGNPHELTSGELSRLLRRLGVRSRPMRLPNGKWGRGYMRAWIESAWRTHRSESDTATHPSKIIALAKP